MTNLPRLTVTQEQAEQMVCVPKNNHYYSADEWVLPDSITLRLPERPTMPCPECDGRGWWSRWRDDVGYRSVRCPDCHGTGFVPIPEGTRVEVGWRGFDLSDPHTRIDADWHPVATATLAVVEVEYLMPPDMGECRYHVTLTDIEAVQS